MKKLIFTCVIIASASIASFAQLTQQNLNNPNGSQPTTEKEKIALQNASNANEATVWAERQSLQMQKEFGLSDAQYSKVLEANRIWSAKIIANRNPTGKTVTPEEMQLIFDERDAKMKEIMSAEQFAKFDMVRPTAIPRSAVKKSDNTGTSK